MLFARRVGAKRSLLFHHDPLHTDGFLDDLHREARERWGQLGGNPAEIEIAAERSELVVAGAGTPAEVADVAPAEPARQLSV